MVEVLLRDIHVVLETLLVSLGLVLHFLLVLLVLVLEVIREGLPVLQREVVLERLELLLHRVDDRGPRRLGERDLMRALVVGERACAARSPRSSPQRPSRTRSCPRHVAAMDWSLKYCSFSRCRFWTSMASFNASGSGLPVPPILSLTPVSNPSKDSPASSFRPEINSRIWSSVMPRFRRSSILTLPEPTSFRRASVSICL